jgi:hypothetical protein
MTMQFVHNGTTYEVRDITRAERRHVAALYPAAFTSGTDGKTAISGHGMHDLCELVFKLSGLTEQALEALSPMEENTLLLTLASEYATGLAGKGSGA